MSEFRILVTGGAGYIGSHAVLALQECGWPIVIIDDLSTGHRSRVPAGVPLYENSIADRVAVESILRDHSIGAIMHFAGSIVVPESVERPLDYYRNNTLASHSLICAAVASGVRHILFSSTAAVYGAPETTPTSEDDPTAPINPYGASKLMTERMLQDASAAHPLNYGALRYFNVAGADPRGRTGQLGQGATHLVKVAVEAAVGRREGVCVFGNDYPTADGTCIRDYIHVSDLAAAHVSALEQLIANPTRSFVLNCGYGRGTSVLEVLDAVERAIGRSLNRTVERRRAGDPPALIAANSRILETLSWLPLYDNIDTIVSHALAWEQQCFGGTHSA